MKIFNFQRRETSQFGISSPKFPDEYHQKVSQSAGKKVLNPNRSQRVLGFNHLIELQDKSKFKEINENNKYEVDKSNYDTFSINMEDHPRTPPKIFNEKTKNDDFQTKIFLIKIQTWTVLHKYAQ